MNRGASYLLRNVLFKQKASETEDLTERIRLVARIRARGNGINGGFWTRGSRRSYQKGQAMTRFKEAERHHQGSERGKSSWSEMMEGEAREQTWLVANCHSVTLIRKNSLKWRNTGCAGRLGSFMTSVYLKSSSKVLLDECKFYHDLWQ